MIQAKTGVNLKQTGIVDPHHLKKLSALSVTTVEELMNLTQEARSFMASFLESHDINNLLEKAINLSSIESSDLNKLKDIQDGFGALPPSLELLKEEAILPSNEIGDTNTSAEADLRDEFGNIRHQGNRGTCVAHAVSALRENAEYKSNNIKDDFSEQFLYWICKMNDRIPNRDGTFQSTAVPLLVQFGECQESIWRYNPQKIEDNLSHGPPPDNALPEAKKYSIREGRCYSPRSVKEIKKRLDEGFPVAVSVPVYKIGESNTFQLPIVRRTGNILMPLPGTNTDGGHAVCLVGYAQDSMFSGGGYFIVRNSWGTQNWGIESPFGKGYGTIPYNYIENYGWEAYSLTS